MVPFNGLTGVLLHHPLGFSWHPSEGAGIFSFGKLLGLTWRIIPVIKWLITMVIVSPLNGLMGPLINGLFIYGL